mgnify:CR=1 FL=1
MQPLYIPIVALFPSSSMDAHTRGGLNCVGVDLVRVSEIRASLDRLGERFLTRLFTTAEIAYVTSAPALASERLAARFAAKEAALKAFGIAVVGIDWRDIEVRQAEQNP